ncbi:MAG: hypothetical protein SGJ09_08440 [Phycisphaerae bacterium]|nr:hypothetical protein [Phycisphaerae bacterium]
MQCNIDSKGKAVRLMGGAIIEGIGLLLVTLWFVGMMPPWAAIVGAVAIVSGLFGIFEGLSGWCVVRAMGFKTPI